MSWGNYGEFATFHFLFHVAETNLWSLIMRADQNTLCCLLPCAGSLHTPYWAYPWASGRVANTNHWHGTALGAGRTGRQRERGFKCRSLPVKLPVNMLYDKWPFWFHRVQENRFEGTSKKPRERKHKQRLPRATQILSLKCSGTSRKNLNSRPAPDGPCPPRPASPARTVRSRAPAGPQPPGRRAMPSPLPRQRWEAVARPRGPARPGPALPAGPALTAAAADRGPRSPPAAAQRRRLRAGRRPRSAPAAQLLGRAAFHPAASSRCRGPAAAMTGRGGGGPETGAGWPGRAASRRARGAAPRPSLLRRAVLGFSEHRGVRAGRGAAVPPFPPWAAKGAPRSCEGRWGASGRSARAWHGKAVSVSAAPEWNDKRLAVRSSLWK